MFNEYRVCVIREASGIQMFSIWIVSTWYSLCKNLSQDLWTSLYPYHTLRLKKSEINTLFLGITHCPHTKPCTNTLSIFGLPVAFRCSRSLLIMNKRNMSETLHTLILALSLLTSHCSHCSEFRVSLDFSSSIAIILCC